MNPTAEPSAEARSLRFRFDPTSDWLFNDLDVEFPCGSVSTETYRARTRWVDRGLLDADQTVYLDPIAPVLRPLLEA